eukprot:gb/GFBE01047739.1/.p1 GENE.gb/GFBE01047739.1/~~gb/GFBE01047739.1/.p1  ORF type:complete len:251 (+),score=65.37 gb/GFBE01047739.1/:1-753(+)
MAYDFHLSTMLPLSFTFKESAKMSHVSKGALRAKETARASLKRAREASERGGTVEACRKAGRAAISAALTGRSTSTESSDDANNRTDESSETVSSTGMPSALALLQRELTSGAGEGKRLLAALKQLSRENIDVVALRKTGIGKSVNDIARKKDARNEQLQQAVALAKQLVESWRKKAKTDLDAAEQVSCALEKLLWEDVATEVEVEDAQDEYEERLLQLTAALSSDAALRRRALDGERADDIVEAALDED